MFKLARLYSYLEKQPTDFHKILEIIRFWGKISNGMRLNLKKVINVKKEFENLKIKRIGLRPRLITTGLINLWRETATGL